MGLILAIFTVIILWCCCIISGNKSREEEQDAETIQLCEEVNKKYDEYVRKFASDNKITIEYAEQMAMVRNYKAYLLKEYGVSENECLQVAGRLKKVDRRN